MFFCPKSTKGNKISSEYAKGLKVVYSAGSDLHSIQLPLFSSVHAA